LNSANVFSLIVICTGICHSCDVEIFPNFYTQNKQKYVTHESVNNDRFLYLNGNQIFERNLLIDFDQQLVQNTVSFEGYTMAFNEKIRAIEQRENQQISPFHHNRCST
jgi:hypothetical protein